VKTLIRSLILLPFLFATSNGYAALDFEDHAFPEFITSARALAMGNAYICKVDDAWSAFYNPAGLGTVRKPQFHIANVHLEASSGFTDIVGGGAAYEIPGNYINTFDPEEMRSMLAESDMKGTLAHARLNLFPNFTVRGMTFGYLVSQRNRAIINDLDPDPNDPLNTYEIAERRDHGPVFSLSGSLFGGVVKLGASAVYLIRRDLYKSFAPDENISIQDTDYQTGKSLQLTAGARVTLPVALLPTFSAVLRNATSNDWDGPSDNGGPSEIEQTVDAGVSITPQIGKMTRLHIEGNLKDVNNAYDTDLKRRLAFGVELDINRRLFVRGGYGDGWGSGGLGVRTRTFILDLTTYAVDRSLDGFREEEDRRWALSLSSGF
jgi:hypothetical protein